ncbi:hypothetical protein V6N12_051356 [Hibiscus sabdariffa]|uniref:Uncharacterized protein n=1 Tax=Hibiscus sabdariffa TaxID=183260 RepID=A0ABR2GFY0_9ROSI
MKCRFFAWYDAHVDPCPRVIMVGLLKTKENGEGKILRTNELVMSIGCVFDDSVDFEVNVMGVYVQFSAFKVVVGGMMKVAAGELMKFDVVGWMEDGDLQVHGMI